MDLIYSDKNRIDVGIIKNYNLDLAYGKDENNFQLTISLDDDNVLDEGYYIYCEYIEKGKPVGTEYGGIVDKLEIDTDSNEVSYYGRTWHGVLDSRIICPEKGYDYFIVSGEANSVIKSIIEHVGLNDMFEVSNGLSDVDIIEYKLRYKSVYMSILDLLKEYDAKLLFKRLQNGKILLKVVYAKDYSQDEEWTSINTTFKISKNYRSINHLICLGQGELRDRYVIHLFTDYYGGIQPYSSINPKQNNDYILDCSNQVITGIDEVCEIYDNPSAEITENYILLTIKPLDWDKNYFNYFILEDGDYKECVDIEQNIFAILTTKPSDWDKNYTNYFQKNGNNYEHVKEVEESYAILIVKPTDWNTNYSEYYKKAENTYNPVEGIEKTNYIKQSKKPNDWSKNWKNYYYFYSDGVTSEYKTVDGITKYKYLVQTRKPTDWNTNYENYYKKKKNGGYKKVEALIKNKKKVAPTWKAKKYYVQESYQVAPTWKSNYFYITKIEFIAPEWKSNTYYNFSPARPPVYVNNTFYKETTIIVKPKFANNMYYKKVYDCYAALVDGGIARLQESYNCDSIEMNIDKLNENYDIGDIVGANELKRNISVWQPITKKIVKIQNGKIDLSYQIGDE